jgi:tetratricopeptide (TPR) repeat protein
MPTTFSSCRNSQILDHLQVATLLLRSPDRAYMRALQTPALLTDDLPAGTSAEGWFKKGNELLGNFSNEEALAAYDKALLINKTHVQVLNNKGRALGRLGRFAEALTEFDKALAINPDFIEAHYNRGHVLIDLKRFEDAAAAYQEAVRIKQDFAAAWYHLALMLSWLGRKESSDTALEKMNEIDPEDPRSWAVRRHDLYDVGTHNVPVEEKLENLGARVAHFRSSGQIERELEAYDAMLSLAPCDAEIWFERGRALCRVERYDEALVTFDRCLEIQPESTVALTMKGITLVNLDRYVEAIDSLDRAIALGPDLPEALGYKGVACYESGRHAEAVENFRKAVQIKHDFVEAWVGLAMAFYALHMHLQVLAVTDTLLELKPDFMAWFMRANALSGLARYQEAVLCYDRALEQRPGDADTIKRKQNALMGLAGK